MRKRRLPNIRFKKKDILIFILSIAAIAELILIIHLLPKKIKPVEVLVPQNRIAIVIDDWGYSKRNIDFIKQIDIPLTISILPNLNYTKEIAKLAKENNKEIIIHLPLEPHLNRELGLEKNVILTNMPQEKIIEIFNKDLENIPYSKGVSNHMGSKATENKRVMSILFELFKKHKLYFLDSLVSPDSICEELAKDMKIRFAKRDVFLDNEGDVDYIKGQLRLLVAKAKEKTQAIGIAHDRPLTLKTIKDSIAEIEKEGIKFVFVSELVK